MQQILLGASWVVTPAEQRFSDFPIPGHTGGIEATLLNRDLSAGPIVAAMKMAPGARIPAHRHARASESFFVLDGDFINAGTEYGAGTFFAVGPGDVHGPHETCGGCTLLFMQSGEVDPGDFFIAE
jgi:quercetin dioxygenase-like cupin family protein